MRSVMFALALTSLVAGAAAACSSSTPGDSGSSSPGEGGAGGQKGSGGAGGGDMAPASWNRDVTPPADADAAAKRLACGYKKDALPAETQGKSNRMGADIPVDTIVVIMQENRSFDHYFQGAKNAGLADMEIAPEGATNLDPDGNVVTAFRDQQFCFVDTAHGWRAVHDQINGGAMDGFVTSNDATHDTPIPGVSLDMMKGDRAMGHYEEADIPFMYWLARNFSIGDHYHASVPGPTWPNRMYLYAASSFGRDTNDFPLNVEATIFDRLTIRGIPWKIYKSDVACYGIFIDRAVAAAQQGKIADLSEFYVDAAAGTLPPVVFIDAGFSLDDKDTYKQENEHPPAIMQYGEAATAQVVDAMTKSPQWARSVTFLTFDEHGGLYDHVVPPAACPPDDIPPDLAPDGAAVPGEKFDQYGIRVPFVAISPYAKRNFVGHHLYDHTSIVRFLESRFTIPALSNRDANAEAPWEMFDFDSPPNAKVTSVPVPTVEQDKNAACAQIWGP